MKNKFTLIELLVVIVIIGILLSLGVTGAKAIWGQNAEAVTRSKMHSIEVAMESYQTAYGTYYENLVIKDDAGVVLKGYTAAGVAVNLDSTIFNPHPYGIYDADSSTVKGDGRAGGFGKYKFCSKEENAKHMMALEDGEDYKPVTFLGTDYIYNEFKDGWGNFFHYTAPGDHNKKKYDLWSRGQDGDGLDPDDVGQETLDDITNWSNQ